MSKTELILRCCSFSLWCQANPWDHDWLFNVYNGGSDELDRMGVQDSAAVAAGLIAQWLYADNRSGPTTGPDGRRRRGREFSEGIGA